MLQVLQVLLELQVQQALLELLVLTVPLAQQAQRVLQVILVHRVL